MIKMENVVFLQIYLNCVSSSLLMKTDFKGVVNILKAQANASVQTLYCKQQISCVCVHQISDLPTHMLILLSLRGMFHRHNGLFPKTQVACFCKLYVSNRLKFNSLFTANPLRSNMTPVVGHQYNSIMYTISY